MKKPPAATERAKAVKRLSKFDDDDIDRITAEAKELKHRPRQLRDYNRDSNAATVWAHVQWRLWRDPDLRGNVKRACRRIGKEIHDFSEDSPAPDDFLSLYNREKKHVEANPAAKRLGLEILEFLKKHHEAGGGLRLPALTKYDSTSASLIAPTRAKRRRVRKTA